MQELVMLLRLVLQVRSSAGLYTPIVDRRLSTSALVFTLTALTMRPHCLLVITVSWTRRSPLARLQDCFTRSYKR